MKLVKFKPIKEAFQGKIYQKLLKPGAKPVKPAGRQQGFKGGTPEYYRKKYKSVYGRVRHSRTGEKVAAAVMPFAQKMKHKVKLLKGHVGYHAKWLGRKIDRTPGLTAKIAMAPGAIAYPFLLYHDMKSQDKRFEKAWAEAEAADKAREARKSQKRKERSDKGKKRGKYRT